MLRTARPDVAAQAVSVPELEDAVSLIEELRAGHDKLREEIADLKRKVDRAGPKG